MAPLMSMNGSHPCLVCREERIEQFLDLGSTALANNFLTAAELDRPEPKFPLRAGFCHNCGHVQLMDPVPPEAMFANYLYTSSTSSTLCRHLDEVAGVACARAGLAPGDLVVDIGSNDGTLLEAFARRGAQVLGVDPAANLAACASQRGVETLTAYFGTAIARHISRERGQARLITATNSFPHIRELDEYLEGVRSLLASDGFFVVEAHYLLDLFEQMAFDTVYHEHVSYWALGPARRLLARHRLEVFDAERLPVHHGQLRLWICLEGAARTTPGVAGILDGERASRLGHFETWVRFSQAACGVRDRLRALLAELRAQGETIAAYGAPAKGNTLLAYLDLPAGTLDWVADRSPLKQGRFTPGTHLLVVSPERIEAEPPNYLLLLAWNFAEEIIRQLQSYRERGGRFIIPVPEARVV